MSGSKVKQKSASYTYFAKIMAKSTISVTPITIMSKRLEQEELR